MTMTEKILAKRSDNASVKPGDNIWAKVDKLLTHDVCGPGTFGIFQKEFGLEAKVRAARSAQGAQGLHLACHGCGVCAHMTRGWGAWR